MTTSTSTLMATSLNSDNNDNDDDNNKKKIATVTSLESTHLQVIHSDDRNSSSSSNNNKEHCRSILRCGDKVVSKVKKVFCSECRFKVNPNGHSIRCRPRSSALHTPAESTSLTDGKSNSQSRAMIWSKRGYVVSNCDGRVNGFFCRDDKCFAHYWDRVYFNR